MSFISDKVQAYLTRDYICPECGKLMTFWNDNDDDLVCESCGYSTTADEYGADPYDEVYPTKEELEFEEEGHEVGEEFDAPYEE